MIEKALYAVLFVYCCSFGMLTAQFIWADVFHVTIRNFQGEEMKSNVLQIINMDNINTITENIVTANFTENTTAFNRVENSTVAAAFVAWELVQLMTGTYIFGVLYFMGVPAILIVGMVIIYVLLLGRAIISYIRLGL